MSVHAQVAAHNAHRGILGGEADAALAAGVNVMLWQETTAGICQLQVLSTLGHFSKFGNLHMTTAGICQLQVLSALGQSLKFRQPHMTAASSTVWAWAIGLLRLAERRGLTWCSLSYTQTRL